MENSRNFYNHELNDESNEDSDKSKEKAKSKKPLKLEGILFNRAEEAKKEQKTEPESLEDDRKKVQEIVEKRQDEVAEEISAADISSDQELVAEADQQLLENIDDRIELVESKGVDLSNESVEETVEAAYKETVEEIEDQPPTLSEARQAMEEAYQGYWAPDYGIKPNTITEPVPENEIAEEVPKTQTETEPRPEYKSKTDTKLGFWGGFAAGFRERSLPRVPRREFNPSNVKVKLERRVNQLKSIVNSREAQIRDLQRDKLRLEQQIEEPEQQIAAELPVEAMTMPVPKPEHKMAEKVHEPESGPAKKESNQNLSKEQLLKLSESIKVDGVTVRSMFEVRRFDETSLRRIVREYLRSGNVTKVVLEEVEKHDKSSYARFETLNQSKPKYTSVGSTDHGTLPQPVEDEQKGQQKPPAPTATDTPKPPKKPVTSEATIYSEGSGLAERVVLILGIGFIFVALVMLFVTIMS